MSWARFWAGLLPTLFQIGRELFRSTGGDLHRAKEELSMVMQDHRARFRAAQPGFEERLRKLDDPKE